jgi:glucan biosynthesis protein C
MGRHHGDGQHGIGRRMTAASGRNANSKDRIVYLDALRAFCMFYGIFSHGATLDHDGNALLTVIKVSSDLFRMATFFLVGGYFTAMVATRTSGAAYVRGRMILILLPLVTTLVTLVPITNYLIHVWHNSPMTLRHYFLEGGWNAPTIGNDVWHLQLWFLFALFAYAMVTPALLALLRRPAVSRGLDRYVAVTGSWTLWCNALIAALFVLAMRTVLTLAVEPMLAETRWVFIARATLTYFPYFALGVAMFGNAGLFRSMHRISWPGLILSLGLFLLAAYGHVPMPGWLDRLLLWTGKAGTIMFIMAALLRLFELNFRHPSRLLSLCVGAAFTFYLFHLTGIYAVATLIGPWLDNVMLTIAVVVVVVPPLVIALHAYVIAPSPLLRLLYNGRLPQKPKPAETI